MLSSHTTPAPQPPLPPQPAYVLRGHAAAIHAVCFVRQNRRLLSGDALGWLVFWSTSSKRAVAVWRAHLGPILGLAAAGPDLLISHGRDATLKVWQLREQDEASFSSSLPVHDNDSTVAAHHKQPWLLHSLDVNTLNFCSFSLCLDQDDTMLVAVPATQDKRVDIFHLPSEQRLHAVPAVQQVETGMVMALALFRPLPTTHQPSSFELVIAAGYESGHIAIHAYSPQKQTWQLLYLNQAHSQPVLSLCLSEPTLTVYTTSADSLLVAHPIPLSSPPQLPSEQQQQPQPLSDPSKVFNTKHAGQQSAVLRSDGRILATAGWDARVRVYSARSLNEVAVLKWHKEGCFAVAFAELLSNKPLTTNPPPTNGAVSNKELDFDAANSINTDAGDQEQEQVQASSSPSKQLSSQTITSASVGGKVKMTFQQQREQREQTKHWLAVGSKDGKVSLWEIY